MPKLVFNLPETGEVTHELAEPVVTLGRLPDNTIQIEDASISSHHAQLSLAGGGNYFLKDLNSTNGTRVNGSNVNEAQLKTGDLVRFGKIEAFYESDIAEAEKPQPLPVMAEATVQTAASSQRPADFTNAAPFQKKGQEKDPLGRALLIFAGVAFALFVVALVFVFLLQPPASVSM